MVRPKPFYFLITDALNPMLSQANYLASYNTHALTHMYMQIGLWFAFAFGP